MERVSLGFVGVESEHGTCGQVELDVDEGSYGNIVAALSILALNTKDVRYLLGLSWISARLRRFINAMGGNYASDVRLIQKFVFVHRGLLPCGRFNMVCIVGVKEVAVEKDSTGLSVYIGGKLWGVEPSDEFLGSYYGNSGENVVKLMQDAADNVNVNLNYRNDIRLVRRSPSDSSWHESMCVLLESWKRRNSVRINCMSYFYHHQGVGHSYEMDVRFRVIVLLVNNSMDHYNDLVNGNWCAQNLGAQLPPMKSRLPTYIMVINDDGGSDNIINRMAYGDYDLFLLGSFVDVLMSGDHCGSMERVYGNPGLWIRDSELGETENMMGKVEDLSSLFYKLRGLVPALSSMSIVMFQSDMSMFNSFGEYYEHVICPDKLSHTKIIHRARGKTVYADYRVVRGGSAFSPPFSALFVSEKGVDCRWSIWFENLRLRARGGSSFGGNLCDEESYLSWHEV